MDEFIKHYQGYKKINNSKQLPEKRRQLAEEREIFVLTPLIAKYKPNEMLSKSLTYNIVNTVVYRGNRGSQISPVFIRPIDALEDLYYHYEMFVPIPENILQYDSEEKMLRELFEIIKGCIEKDFMKLIYTLEPQRIIGRLYGWDGAWLSYSVKVKDDKKAFWSTPLVNSPYKDTQPFIAVPQGEFVILESDRSKYCENRIKELIARIKDRIKGIDTMSFEKLKEIKVDREWLIAYSIATVINRRERCIPSDVAQSQGETIQEITHQKEMSTEDLLNIQRTEIYAKPVYEFDADLIREYSIP